MDTRLDYVYNRNTHAPTGISFRIKLGYSFFVTKKVANENHIFVLQCGRTQCVWYVGSIRRVLVLHSTDENKPYEVSEN